MTHTIRRPLFALTLTALIAPSLMATGCDGATEEELAAEACELDGECDDFRGAGSIAMAAFGFVGKLALKSAYENSLEKMLWPQGPVTLSQASLNEIASIVEEQIDQQYYDVLSSDFTSLFSNFTDYYRSECPNTPVACASDNYDTIEARKVEATNLYNAYLLVLTSEQKLQSAQHIQAIGGIELAAHVESLALKKLKGELNLGLQADVIMNAASGLLDTYATLEQMFDAEIDSRFSACQHVQNYYNDCTVNVGDWMCLLPKESKYSFTEKTDDGSIVTHDGATYSGHGTSASHLNACNATLTSKKATNSATARPKILTADFDDNIETIKDIYTKHYWYDAGDVTATVAQLPHTGSNTTSSCINNNTGMVLTNANGSASYSLLWQNDGNLVAYGPAGATWASGTQGMGTLLCFQSDGNLVIYDNGGPLWASDTAEGQHGGAGKGGASLHVTPSGNVTIENSAGAILWETGSGQMAPR